MSARWAPIARKLAAQASGGRGVGLAVALAVAVCLSSLSMGLVGDDVGHRKFLLDHLRSADAPGHFWDMFDVVGRLGPAEVQLRVWYGALPWWTSPSLKLALLRPLSVLSQYLDHALWPDAIWAMHLHNIALRAVMVWLAALLYRRLLGATPLAALALLLYAVDEAHASGTAWIASRNTLLTAIFVLLTLVLYERARATARWAPVALSALALVLGLASSEGAVAVWAYLGAYAVCLDRGPLRARVGMLVPLALAHAAFAVLSHSLGYGARGSGLYVDPRSDPLYFVTIAADRLPGLLRAQLTLPMQLWPLHAAVEPATWLLLALVAVASVPALLRSRTARFFALGSLLAILPLCAVGVVPRLLFLVGFGAHGLLAEVLHGTFAGAVASSRAVRPHASMRAPALAAAAVIFVLHGPVALATGPFTPVVWRAFDARVMQASQSLPASVPGVPTAVLVLNATEYLVAMFAVMYRASALPPGAQLIHVLGASERPITLSRPDPNTLVLEPEGGYLLEHSSQLTRKPTEPFARGSSVALAGLLVTVDEITSDGRPARVRLSLEDAADPRLRFVTWQNERNRFEPVRLPPVGGRLRLPGLRPATDDL